MEFAIGSFLGASVMFLVMNGLVEGYLVSKVELFERGHMVQCVGKTGYYWECEK